MSSELLAVFRLLLMEEEEEEEEGQTYRQRGGGVCRFSVPVSDFFQLSFLPERRSNPSLLRLMFEDTFLPPPLRSPALYVSLGSSLQDMSNSRFWLSIT